MSDPDFGTDFDFSVPGPDGLPGLSPTFDLVSGRDLLIQSILHRYQTPRGSLVDDPNYGFDVQAWLNESLTNTRLYALQSGLAAEALKDERVLSAAASVTYDGSTKSITYALAITPSASPAFTLTIAVTSLTLELLSVS
jgi:phage baseplate assembly protein W